MPPKPRKQQRPKTPECLAYSRSPAASRRRAPCWRSVPLPPRKTPERDEADQGDDHSEQEAPEDRDHDSDDDEDAAKGYATHAEPPCSMLPLYRRRGTLSQPGDVLLRHRPRGISRWRPRRWRFCATRYPAAISTRSIKKTSR